MKLALAEDLKNLKKGTPVLVNLSDTVSDIGIFLEYLPSKRKILVLDTFSLGEDKRYHGNICEYDKCMLLDLSDEMLLHYSGMHVRG